MRTMQLCSLVTLAVAIVAAVAPAAAQEVPTNDTSRTIAPIDAPRMRLGLVGAGAVNLHSASFVALPGVPNCCPEFESGSGLGVIGGLVVELPLASRLSLDARATYSSLGATLERSESTMIERDGVAVPASIDHRIDASLSAVAAELRASWHATERLRVAGGVRGGIRVGGRFEQIEQLGDEVDRGAFENGRRTRNEFTGDIPEASPIDIALLAGVGYEVPLVSGGALIARPELTFAVGLAPVSSAVSWSVHQAQLGVAFLWTPPRPAPEPAPVVAQPAPRDVRIAIEIEMDGKEVAEIAVVEQVERWLSPLVPAVFFDSASHELAARYRALDRGSSGTFSIDSMTRGDFVDDHRQILNIVGDRMRRRDDVTISLFGSVQRGESPELARARAERVAEYLRDIWGIDRRRVRLASSGDPMPRADETTEDGRQENRHVAIVASSSDLLAPVRSARSSLHYSSSSIRIRPTVDTGAGLVGWRLGMSFDGEELEGSRGTVGADGELDPIVLPVESLGVTPDTVARPLSIDYTVRDRDGNEGHASASVPVILRRSDRWTDGSVERTATLEKISWQLVAFELDSPEPGRVNRALLRELASTIAPGASITIRGYSDRMGIVERNAKLASDRAASVARILEEELAEDLRRSVTIDARGEGVDQNRFTNDLPEGRLLSRGVSIEIEQKIDAPAGSR